MSHWNIAAAQYGGLHQTVDDHVTHHLRFIAEAARQRCDLLVFPELSLTGSGAPTLPPPPDDAQLEPLLNAAHLHQITVIAGLPWNRMASARKALCCFRPLAIAFCAIRKGAVPAWCRGINTLASLIHIPIRPISIPGQRLLPAASRWGIIAGGSPSVTCSASRINMPLRC